MSIVTGSVGQKEWERLAEVAWTARSRAFIYGNTAVGAAVLVDSGSVFAGCNVEHKFRSHDIHAETNAISTMIASGCHKIEAVLVVAERERFTPCGACMDWIFQFGGADCLVGFQGTQQGEILVLRASELMPYYPH